ncbi:MAG: hypothetical protein OIN83_08110 [Candidatus Methanoperedens sp.]|nr:hypothetical protein [Candidatus Methanoperedens sp.]
MKKKPQMNVDERRFVTINRQSCAIPGTTYEKAPPSRHRTQMTLITRICADNHPRLSASSAQSVFQFIASAFIRVNLRLILSMQTGKVN